MKELKKYLIGWGVLFIGIFLLFAGTVAGEMIVNLLCEAYGIYADGKVVVSFADEAAASPDNSLDARDIQRLSEEPGTENLAAAAVSKTTAGYGIKNAVVVARGVTFNYRNFITLKIKEGNFLARTDEIEKNRVAVIDEELALMLYNTADAAGNDVVIYGVNFKITGVITKDSSLLGALTRQKEPSVYIPLNVMLELDEKAKISSVQIKTEGENLLGRNVDMVSSALEAIGKSLSGIKIADYGIKSFFMRQKVNFAVFIPGMLLIIMLSIYMKRSIKIIVDLIKTGCKADYLSNVIKVYKAEILKQLASCGIILTIITAVWLGIRFEFYVPQDWIPDELIDLSHYQALIKDMILQNNSRIGYTPPIEEIMHIKAQGILDVVFYLSQLAGIPMMLTGLCLLRLKNASLAALAPVCSLMVFLALLLIAFLAVAAGMPIRINTKGVLVLFAYTFISSIIFSKERDEVLSC